jgi:uroporphyrinogen III methyltransferase/synthase
MKLDGKTIVVTRATHQFAEMAIHIQQLGGKAISFPTIAIETAPVKHTDIDTVRQIMSGAYNWVVFTSVNGVTHLPLYAQQLHREVSIHPETRIAAIGQTTSQRIRTVFHREVDHIPVTTNASGLFDELIFMRPTRVCWVCGNLAAPQQTPYVLDCLVTYHTVCATDGPEFASISADVIVFQSGSAVHNFVTRMHNARIDINSLRTIRFAYHGATAYHVAHALNLPRHFYCESGDSVKFLQQLADYLAQENDCD